MALKSAIPVDFDTFFPYGAYVVGEVEPVVKWSEDGDRQGQDLDKVTGHPIWRVRVIDADPEARKGQAELMVKIASVTEPQLPPELNGLPFRPTVFEGLSVTPYVPEGQGRGRVAYSLRARVMKPAPKSRGAE
ncbi:plasmid replication, integration and excision activator [Microbacterium sp. F2E]|uniref:plasmid replication, integration and excision activator n=1 Tax=Microbacterium sp. F2E TaxID=2895284 RepID=UPI001E49B2D3|nr:plasmid replication, integration and excision activator [Microbacterium sp. F2E]MCC9055088.1 plasmid replication, integration and excision activator [Microbacterium sp. F2E]